MGGGSLPLAPKVARCATLLRYPLSGGTPDPAILRSLGSHRASVAEFRETTWVSRLRGFGYWT